MFLFDALGASKRAITFIAMRENDKEGYTTETCKETGKNGKRRNIGTGEVSKAAEGTVRMTACGMVIKTANDEMNKKAGINRSKEEI